MGCLLVLRQLLLLLWKNFVLQIRRPVGTVFELLLPSLALLVIVGLRQIPGATDLFRTCPSSFQSTDLTARNSIQLRVVYAPDNDIS
jgi:ATP-binding cassette subfamily A (ABC1) protein 3